MVKIVIVLVGVNGLLFYFYLFGEWVLLWNVEVSVSFIGLCKNYYVGYLVWVVVEGICFNLKIILEDLK